eukprot:CAMPEP_0118961974 /NCGR_PEP_ID=MMETSP1173-20130426/476_1 /TAXON_ID=1034831 /ORGANISM="Rhizochromulina marina cf, Strain CCMP1243" /LENGTH=330 /DNA_ID=CAMNT_0006910183 /DNA_START=52 /DNA_END=1044 /DNA_ORIENTATION=+
MQSLVAVALAMALGVAQADLFTLDEGKLQFMWSSFKTEYSKSYSSDAEDAERYQIFVANLAIADERNVREHHAGGSAVHGITKFMDLSPSEFVERYLTAQPTGTSNATAAPVKPLGPRTSVSQDWTGTLTTPVKDQGYCGSCWAFSAVEQIETDTMRTLGETYILSPAQIVSCDSTAYGCSGGWTERAYNYVSRTGGLESEDDYPYPYSMYEGASGTCSSESSKYQVTVDEYYTVSSESQMASYVGSTGPLSVCLDAMLWNTYTGGIMSVCGNNVDHCVQAVGVDTDEGYWKVRNSWGTSWGESGFIRLAYGANTCDITSDPTYVDVSLV